MKDLQKVETRVSFFWELKQNPLFKDPRLCGSVCSVFNSNLCPASKPKSRVTRRCTAKELEAAMCWPVMLAPGPGPK